jgi:hypothetical protein
MSEAGLFESQLTPLNPRVAQQERNLTFFFAGSICGGGRDRGKNCTEFEDFDDLVFYYSGGVRQKVEGRLRPGAGAPLLDSACCHDDAGSSRQRQKRPQRWI